MTNHTRTLLINLPGQGITTGEGEAYTSPSFRPVPLPAALQTVRQVLYGQEPDRLALLYRTWQFLALLHASPLRDHMTAQDLRITYLPLDAAKLHFPAEVLALPQGHTTPLYLAGLPPIENGTGKTTYAWTVARTTTGVAVTTPDGRETDTVDPFTAGLSALVPLPGSGLSVQIPGTVYVGAAWLVTATVRPTADLGDLLRRLETVGDDVLVALFGLETTEPWATWRALWASDMPMAYRLGAALLALAARTDAIRTGAV